MMLMQVDTLGASSSVAGGSSPATAVFASHLPLLATDESPEGVVLVPPHPPTPPPRGQEPQAEESPYYSAFGRTYSDLLRHDIEDGKVAVVAEKYV